MTEDPPPSRALRRPTSHPACPSASGRPGCADLVRAIAATPRLGGRAPPTPGRIPSLDHAFPFQQGDAFARARPFSVDQR
ncbi:hypothetical protein G6F65_021648 [Rhizopus arrhizus]|nr:hypothetical protein G6F65_021648 [Rhizopus arrhizus]